MLSYFIFKKAFFRLYIFPILTFIYMFIVFPLLVMSSPLFSPVFSQCIFSTIWFDFIIPKNKILDYFLLFISFLRLNMHGFSLLSNLLSFVLLINLLFLPLHVHNITSHFRFLIMSFPSNFKFFSFFKKQATHTHTHT